MTRAAICLGLAATLAAAPARADDRPYRTEGGDPARPWYVPKPGVFPPADAVHRDTGRLVRADGYNRTGRYIADTVHRIEYLDSFTDFELLPYGTVRRCGAPADLRDLPVGSHLHLRVLPAGPPPHIYSGSKFTGVKVLSIEDDFSDSTRRGELLRIERVDANRGRVFVTVRKGGKPVGDPKKWTELSVDAGTRVWKGRSIGTPADLAAGQDVLVNLTGSIPFQNSPLQAHCTDVWVDVESRQAATEAQAARHRAWVRRRGVPAWVDKAEGRRVTMTLFDEVDTFADDGPPERWEGLRPGRTVHLQVATDSLRMWLNDNGIDGKIIEARAVPRAVGCGGLTIVVEPRFLLEGFRPGKVVRIFPAGWSHGVRPPEEDYHPLMSP